MAWTQNRTVSASFWSQSQMRVVITIYTLKWHFILSSVSCWYTALLLCTIVQSKSNLNSVFTTRKLVFESIWAEERQSPQCDHWYELVAAILSPSQHAQHSPAQSLSPPAGTISPTPPWVREDHSSPIFSSANRGRCSLQVHFLPPKWYLLARRAVGAKHIAAHHLLWHWLI